MKFESRLSKELLTIIENQQKEDALINKNQEARDHIMQFYWLNKNGMCSSKKLFYSIALTLLSMQNECAS